MAPRQMRDILAVARRAFGTTFVLEPAIAERFAGVWFRCPRCDHKNPVLEVTDGTCTACGGPLGHSRDHADGDDSLDAYFARAHAYSSCHNALLQRSQAVTCFNCFRSYPASVIADLDSYCDEEAAGGPTALCVYCELDTILPNAAQACLKASFPAIDLQIASLAFLRDFCKRFFDHHPEHFVGDFDGDFAQMAIVDETGK